MPPAEAAVGAAGAAADGQPQQRGGGFFQSIIRMVMMYYAMKMFTGGGNKGAQQADGKEARIVSPRLPRGHPLDMHLFISEEASWQAVAAQAQPVWLAADVALAEPDVKREATFVYRPSKVGGQDDFFDHTATFARTQPLNRYLKKRAAKEGVNLLSGKNSTDDAAMPDDMALGNETIIISYLHPNITLQMVDDFSKFNERAVPPQYKDLADVDPATLTYAPHIWFNNFWLLRDYLVPVNESLAELELHLELSSVASWKYMLMSQDKADGEEEEEEEKEEEDGAQDGQQAAGGSNGSAAAAAKARTAGKAKSKPAEEIEAESEGEEKKDK
ncbi:hypothetical protein CHLNCDRAFT_142853 [Chlorella variabilis]|uniref:Uncharacterized protein n=1 Tax=Chlorella variabilis TaxID=554065 RepID=E1Z8X0_CHLVA|nr:hypothetical protein CHLNCDRAFT_142853 [Chlorella variabilis]EFN57413.1 hypothetical protein CHLNCDRAFT_142853 [Chlorella variabilis]|eukprot:XP_005849515.1 hypothetical protein CHLNCDRAFT_142853 [Chlorella variabilis]